MNKAFERLKSFNWYDFLLALLFFLFFKGAFVYIWTTFTSPEFYENGIAFILVSAAFVFSVIKNKHVRPPIDKSIPFISLVVVLTLYSLNLLILKLSILSAILLLLGSYCLLGFYLERQFWKRSIFVFSILVLTLPLLERVQKFIGFPIRLATANIVSSILQITGVGSISNSAVIITENHATSIDSPCSGVKSIYTGGLFMLTTYFLQNVRISIKLIAITVFFFISLLFFNTWRVFSLIYIYDVLNMKLVGDTIHVLLGLVGFIASCSLLWYLTDRYIPSLGLKKAKQKPMSLLLKGNITAYAIVVLLFFTVFRLVFVKDVNVTKYNNQYVPHIFTLNNIKLDELSFSKAEESYFVNSDIEFSKKFRGQTKEGAPFSLLVVSSKSARTHHDPEICLQGLGHTLTNNEILQVSDFRVRKLSLDDNKASAIYWFIGKDKNLLDYSERVWEEIKNPNQTWVLVTIGFSDSVDTSKQEIKDLILKINSESKSLL